MRELAARRVAIHALDARLGHEDAELLFELFRARAEIFDIAAAAFRADVGHGLADVAVMAEKQLAAALRLMVDERHAAVGTMDDLAARAAHDECRVTAPVQHDDELLVRRDGLADQIFERPRDDVAIAHAELLPHVDARDLWERDVADTMAHAQKCQFACLCSMIRFKRRRRAAEQQHGMMQMRELFSHDARMVARRFVLLVAHVLFLVEDDEADIIGRREKR